MKFLTMNGGMKQMEKEIAPRRPQDGPKGFPDGSRGANVLIRVVQSMSCELCGAIYVVQSMCCALCDAIYAIGAMLCELRGVSHVVLSMW